MDITIDFSGITFPITTGRDIIFRNEGLILRPSADPELYIKAPEQTTYDTVTDYVAALFLSSDARNSVTPTGTYTITANGGELTITSTDSFIVLDNFRFETNNVDYTTDLAFTDNHTGDTLTFVNGVANPITGIISGNPGFRRLSIDTGQTVNIAQTLILTRNDGSLSLNRLLAQNGTGVGSSYTLVDYTGTERAAFSASSGETLASVLGRMETAIDDNTETPIDFMAQVSGGSLILTGQAVGSLNPGMPSTAMWRATVDHGTGSGDISITGLTRNTTGRDDLSNINTNVPTAGAIEFDNFYGATFGDN